MKQEVKDVQDSGSDLGYVVGDNTSDIFRFVLSENSQAKKWEYVYMDINGSKVLGRVERIISKSELLNDSMDYESVNRYVSSDLDYSVNLCLARTLGSMNGGNLELSRDLIRPGTKVYKATSQMLEKIFRFDEDESLDIGYLADRSDVRVSLSVSGMRRHVAIVAQTGAGKSHTAGVLMEELLKKGASIVVLDPHADYVLMRKSQAGSFYSNSIRVFRTPLSTGRYDSFQQGIVNEFTLRFADLEADDVSEIMGIKESWTNLRKSVELSVKNMHGKRDLEDFVKAAESLDPPEDYHKIAGRIRLLSKVRSIFGDRTTGLADYIQPGMMSILDLSGMDQFLANYFSYRVINEIYESKLTSQYRYPVFIFIEEAHNFVPPGSSTQISQMIKKVASEGRKFGIFLVVITQRPGKIDQDVLSQCNSEIILRITNPLDQKAILESGESISQAVIDDLPSLNVGEAILVGQFVKVPVNVKVRSRESKEGGGDIDVVALLRESRMERDEKNSASGDLKRISRILGD